MMPSTQPFALDAEPLAPAERQLVVGGDLQRVRHAVVDGTSVRGTRRSSSREPLRVARRVVGVQRQPARQQPAQVDLQRVVLREAPVGRDVGVVDVGIEHEEVARQAGGLEVGAERRVAVKRVRRATGVRIARRQLLEARRVRPVRARCSAPARRLAARQAVEVREIDRQRIRAGARALVGERARGPSRLAAALADRDLQVLLREPELVEESVAREVAGAVDRPLRSSSSRSPCRRRAACRRSAPRPPSAC